VTVTSILTGFWISVLAFARGILAVVLPLAATFHLVPASAGADVARTPPV
jgi:hypothetical protein